MPNSDPATPIDENSTLYIDPAGPVAFIVGQAELLALASLAKPESAAQLHDPVLHQALRRHFSGRTWVSQASLHVNPGDLPTLTVVGEEAADRMRDLFRDLVDDAVISRLLGPFRLGASADAPGGVEVYRREPD